MRFDFYLVRFFNKSHEYLISKNLYFLTSRITLILVKFKYRILFYNKLYKLKVIRHKNYKTDKISKNEVSHEILS